MTDELWDERPADRSHQRPRSPAPTAPWGTLLYAIQLARFETRGALNSSGGEDRNLCVRYTETHGGLLVGVQLTADQIGFVRTCRVPWSFLLDQIRTAMRPVSRRVVRATA